MGTKKEQIISSFLWDMKEFIRQITSLLLTRKFQIEEFEIIFLGEVEIVIKLGVKSWFADMGLSTGDFIWDLFLFNRYDEIKALSSVHFSCSVGSGSL